MDLPHCSKLTCLLHLQNRKLLSGMVKYKEFSPCERRDFLSKPSPSRISSLSQLFCILNTESLTLYTLVLSLVHVNCRSILDAFSTSLCLSPLGDHWRTCGRLPNKPLRRRNMGHMQSPHGRSLAILCPSELPLLR